MSYFLLLMLLSVICALNFESVEHWKGNWFTSQCIRLALGPSAMAEDDRAIVTVFFLWLDVAFLWFSYCVFCVCNLSFNKFATKCRIFKLLSLVNKGYTCTSSIEVQHLNVASYCHVCDKPVGSISSNLVLVLFVKIGAKKKYTRLLPSCVESWTESRYGVNVPLFT